MIHLNIHICKTTEDIKQLAALAKEIWTEHFVPIIGQAQVDYMLEKFQSERAITQAVQQDQYRYFMALDQKVLIGYCGVRPEQNDLFLSKLYLHKSYRGQGLSRKLLDQAIAFGQAKKLKSIYLTVNKYNDSTIAIYKKIGFDVEDEMVTDIGQGYVMDDYKMRLSI